MMKKFNKKKGSRQGTILVTVVFILAFAIIFIAAAMMLTQHTRKRVYEEAESNQARLTVTSVAEAFYRAVQKCEFLDDDVLQLAKGHKTIRVQASSYADTIPGLENYGTTSTDSYTTAEFNRTHKAGAGTTDDDYTYYVDFSTHIDGKVENVRAELSYVTPHTDTDGAPFSTQFDLNADFDQVNLENVGEGKEGDLDNIFLVRKNANQASSSYSSSATMVYCDGNVSFKEEILKSTDIVFLQGAKLKVGSGDMCKWNKGSSKVKNLFFFGSGSESISDDNTRGNFGDVASGLNFYLCGRTNNTAWTSGNNVIEINANGKKTDGTPVFSNQEDQTNFENKVKVYASYNTQYKKGGTNPYPTTDTFLRSSRQMNHNAVSSKTAPSNPTWSGKLGSFLTNKCFQKTGGYLTPGTYVIDGDDSDQTDNHPSLKCAKFPYVIVLEGGKNYQFWFKGNQDYKLKNVIFIVNDPKPAYPVLFLLENKANIYWPGGSDGVVCGNGILAVEGRKFTNAQKTFDFIDEAIYLDNNNQVKFKYATPKNFENTSGKYSTRYDSSNEVCAMVIGMGNNHFELDKNVLMEAFIGLFNDSYEKANQSMIRIRNNDNGAYYCRFMTDGYSDKDAGNWDMPATPSSTALPNPNPPIKKLVTGFSLNSMKYYYNITPIT